MARDQQPDAAGVDGRLAAAQAAFLPARSQPVSRPPPQPLASLQANQELWLLQLPSQVPVESLNGLELELPVHGGVGAPATLPGTGGAYQLLDDAGAQRHVMALVPEGAGSDAAKLLAPVARRLLVVRAYPNDGADGGVDSSDDGDGVVPGLDHVAVEGKAAPRTPAPLQSQQQVGSVGQKRPHAVSLDTAAPPVVAAPRGATPGGDGLLPGKKAKKEKEEKKEEKKEKKAKKDKKEKKDKLEKKQKKDKKAKKAEDKVAKRDAEKGNKSAHSSDSADDASSSDQD